MITIFIHILTTETIWQLEVQLEGTRLPVTAQRILHGDIYLWAIEGAIFVFNQIVTFATVLIQHFAQGGFSFIRVKMDQGVRKYEAFFFHALQFSDGPENASTKEKQIAWNHPTMDASGIGVYIDSSGEAKYFNWMEFETQTAAETWITSQAS